MVEKGHDACSPTEHGINPGLVLHAVLSPFKGFLDVHVPLLVVLVRQPKLQIFDLLCRLFWVLVLVRTVYFVRVFANLREEAIVLFRITEDVKLPILLALNHVCENFRQVDFDKVDLSNLQRQILHKTSDISRLKIDSAKEHLLELNPNINIHFRNF